MKTTKRSKGNQESRAVRERRQIPKGNEAEPSPKWSQRDKRAVEALYLEGMSVTQLADDLGVTVHKIYGVTKSLGTQMRGLNAVDQSQPHVRKEPEAKPAPAARNGRGNGALNSHEQRLLYMVAGIHRKTPKQALNALLQQEVDDHLSGRSRLFGGTK
jgi:hypothetical protein